MEILDIHTHHSLSDVSLAIRSCLPGTFSPQAGGYYSVGIHPWYLTAENLERQWDDLQAAAQSPQVLAIGEAGLDKLADVPFSLQLTAFEQQVKLAGRLELPLVIHAVRASNEIIQLKQQYRPRNSWIIHGFRGKEEQALQYLRQGISLSFGEKYNEAALRAVPLDRLFIETDESEVDIHLLYKRAASVRGMAVDELVERVRQNINNVFFR